MEEYVIVQIDSEEMPQTELQRARMRLLAARAANPTKRFKLVRVTRNVDGSISSEDTRE